MTSFVPGMVGKEPEGAERRANPRKALRANAELFIGGQKVPVRTLDISITGVAIATPINPRVGLSLSLLLAPASAPRGTARIEMAVTVVHSILTASEGEFKVGLHFGTLAPAATELVKKYLQA